MRPSQHPDISVLVVGFNSAMRLAKCFSAIERAIGECAAEVLFINNGSDQSEDVVRDRFPWVQIFESHGNIGFAAANNHLARNARGRFLLLVNPDTEIDVRAVELLLSAAQNAPQYGILGGTTLFANDSNKGMPALQLPNTYRLFREIFARRRTSRDLEHDLKPVEATSGGFMLIRREIWQRLSGMDERFFLYAEDIDLCKRASESDIGIGAVPAAKIHHDVGSGAFYSRTRQLYQAKGNATYHWKHFSTPRAITNIGLIWLRLLIRAVGAGILAPTSDKHLLIFRSLAPLTLMPWRWVPGYTIHRRV